MDFPKGKQISTDESATKYILTLNTCKSKSKYLNSANK